MTDHPVRQWIDRWEAADLVDADLAERLRADVASAHGEAPAAEDVSSVEHVLSRARSGVVEALGYLGAALTLGTAAVLLDVTSWHDAAVLVLLLVVAGVAAAGTFRLTPARTGRARRLAGVLGATAVAALYTVLAQVFDGRCTIDCESRVEVLQNLGVTVPAAVVAAVVYARHRHLLTHAALGIATLAVVFAVGTVVQAGGGSYQAQDVTVGLLLLGVASAWMWASETGRLDPAWLGTLGAGGVTYMAVVKATSWEPLSGTGDESATILATLAVAVALTLVGVAGSRLRLTIVGIAGLLITVPATFTEVFGWSATQTALLLLPIGIALTAWAIAAGRGESGGVESPHG